MDTRDSAAVNSPQCVSSSHPLRFTCSEARPASQPCAITALNTKTVPHPRMKTAAGHRQHTLLFAQECLRERGQTPGFDCEPAPVSEVAEDGSGFFRVFQWVTVSQPLLCLLCGPDCCPRARALKDDQLCPGLCPLDANSTAPPLPSWASEASPDIAKCSWGGRLALFENHWVRANKQTHHSQDLQAFSLEGRKGQRGIQEITGKGKGHLERGSQTRADICLFRFQGPSYQGTLFNGVADHRLGDHCSQISPLSLLIATAPIWKLFLFSALFEETSEWGHKD